MLIIALVLALIGLVALVFAVVTSNELVAWVCIGASVLGVVLLIVDALRERQGRGKVALEGGEASLEDSKDPETAETAEGPGDDAEAFVDYPEEVADEGDNEPDKEQKPSEEAESAVPADGNGEDSAK
jgi:hypothetical protein